MNAPAENLINENALVEIEQRVLGWFLYNVQGSEACIDDLERIAHFLHNPHTQIAGAIVDASRSGAGTGASAIAVRIRADDALAEIGGADYLRSIAGASPAIVNAADGERQIREALRTIEHEHRCNSLINDIDTAKDALKSRELPISKVVGTLRASLEAAESALLSSKKVVSSDAFVRGFTPPDYILDGIIQRGFLYSLTAPTGAGKTAIAMRLMAHVALGRELGGLEVQSGPVMMLAGENADDVRMRWIALSEQVGFDQSEISAQFAPGVFDVEAAMPSLKAAARQAGGLALIVVDTSAAYFTGQDENSNVEAGAHARLLRQLTTLSGNPAVLVCAHPTKNASSDNLLPRGGGAFIAEVDGNLVARQSDGVVELHWQGKFRGPDFQPLSFEMLRVESPRLLDSRGRNVPTVVAKPLTELEQTHKASVANDDLRALLRAMHADPGASIAALAEALNWRFADSSPAKSRVTRRLKDLETAKLATKELGSWRLTPRGEETAKRLPK